MPKLAPLNFPQYKAYPYFQKCSFPNFFFSSALTCPIIPHHPSRPPPCPHHRPAYTHLPFSSPFPSPLSFPSPFFSLHFPSHCQPPCPLGCHRQHVAPGSTSLPPPLLPVSCPSQPLLPFPSPSLRLPYSPSSLPTWAQAAAGHCPPLPRARPLPPTPPCLACPHALALPSSPLAGQQLQPPPPPLCSRWQPPSPPPWVIRYSLYPFPF